MNYYVLSVQTQTQDVFCELLNREKGLVAYCAKLEYYRRDIKGIALKALFPGYIIVKSEYNQSQFDDVLKRMEVKKGFQKELKFDGTSALTDEEIQVLNMLLDESGVLRMSYGHLENRRIVIDKGPLVGFEQYVTKVDKHNHILCFDLYFLENQQWKAGITITQDDEK